MHSASIDQVERKYLKGIKKNKRKFKKTFQESNPSQGINLPITHQTQYINSAK